MHLRQGIRLLSYKDSKQILSFVYKREKENLFVIGSFNRYKNPFNINKYFGHFKNGRLTGLAVYFSLWKSFVVSAQQKKVINMLVDEFVKEKLPLEAVPVFKKYGLAIINRLKKKYSIKPKHISRETVFLLDKKSFCDFSNGKEHILSNKKKDEFIMTMRKINGESLAKPITAEERRRIDPGNIFVIYENNKIVSAVTLHGYSKKYFQIGGVGTLKQYRGRGYAKRVVSAICKYYFNKGKKFALLFTANKNTIAQKVYKAVGFRPIDEFIIAQY